MGEQSAVRVGKTEPDATSRKSSEGGRGAATRSEMQKLRAEHERLKTKLAKAETIIEVQGKVQALLEELSKSADTDET
jgi:hypothetical protein